MEIKEMLLVKESQPNVFGRTELLEVGFEIQNVIDDVAFPDVTAEGDQLKIVSSWKSGVSSCNLVKRVSNSSKYVSTRRIPRLAHNK